MTVGANAVALKPSDFRSHFTEKVSLATKQPTSGAGFSNTVPLLETG